MRARVSDVADDQVTEISKQRGAAMNEHDNTSTHISPASLGQPDSEDTEAVDELMDHVAALLQSQMQAANRQLRRRAARLLDPARTRMSHEGRPSSADR
jgi:hypothetical protein